MIRSSLVLSALLCSLGLPTAHAAELVWDGAFTSRARYFNSLSLSGSNSYAEGAAFGVDNRLRLQPQWQLSSNASIYAQVDLLPHLNWGTVATEVDPISGEESPVALSQSVTPPVDEEGGATLQNIQVTRAWGEVDTAIGRVSFGRMPLDWGTGMVYNAGTNPDSEYGDTVDRLMLTSRVGPVYLFGAWEVPFEGYVNQRDDVWGATAGLKWQTETAAIGTYQNVRWMNNVDDDETFAAYTGDIYAWARLGEADVSFEFATVLGQGDLGEANDIGITSFGTHLTLAVPFDRLQAGLTLGFASGDKDSTDDTLRAFSYDPDFNRTIFLFEEPMPTLEAANANAENGGRNYDAVLTGEGISNAIFFNPSAGWRFNEKVGVSLSAFGATRAALIDDTDKATRGYGWEFDLGATYQPFPFFTLQGTAGTFLPGKYFRAYEDDTYGDGFEDPAFGARVLGTVQF